MSGVRGFTIWILAGLLFAAIASPFPALQQPAATPTAELTLPTLPAYPPPAATGTPDIALPTLRPATMTARVWLPAVFRSLPAGSGLGGGLGLSAGDAQAGR